MRQAVSLISNIHQRPSRHGETKSKSKNILLSMLSCADVIVRRESYRCCCEVVKKALKHSHVTNPMSKHYTKALFVIDRDVIYVVCAFGMADSDEEVGSFDKVLTFCCTECLESIIRQVDEGNCLSYSK
jgi:rotatin